MCSEVATLKTVKEKLNCDWVVRFVVKLQVVDTFCENALRNINFCQNFYLALSLISWFFQGFRNSLLQRNIWMIVCISMHSGRFEKQPLTGAA